METAITKLILIIQSQDINFDSESDTLQLCVEDAVDKYSHDVPIRPKVDLVGSGGSVLNFPGTFTYDFSAIKNVEYPVDDTVGEKTYLTLNDDYSLYRKPDGTMQLLLVSATPDGASDPVRVEYTKYSYAISDVPEYHERAVLQLSAYYACLSEANKANNTTSDGEGLDFVEHTTASSRYEAIGEKFKRNYDDIIFGNPDNAENLGKTVVYSEHVQWETEPRFGGSRIFHPDDSDG